MVFPSSLSSTFQLVIFSLFSNLSSWLCFLSLCDIMQMEILKITIDNGTHWNSSWNLPSFPCTRLYSLNWSQNGMLNTLHTPKYTNLYKDHLLRIDYSRTCSVLSFLHRISILTKIIRITRLNLIVFLPLVIKDVIIFSVIIGLVELLSAVVFCLKFTYQSILSEYYLMVGYMCGLLSYL